MIIQRYFAIVSATDLEQCFLPEQIAQVVAYELAFSVKTVIMYTFPYPHNGVEATSGTGDDGILSLSSSFDAIVKSIPTGAQIPMSGSYAYVYYYHYYQLLIFTHFF